MKKLALSALILLFVLVSVLVWNASLVTSKQITAQSISVLSLKEPETISRLQKALRFKTISYDDETKMDKEAFQDLHQHIRNSYPLLTNKLNIEVINEMTLLLHWQGSEPSKKPIMMLNHLDVVPVQTHSLNKWEAAPFAAKIINDYIYARGAMDTKSGAIATLEAIELLIAKDFQPKRSIYISLGHDEEIGGRQGNVAVVDLLKKRNVHFEFVIDEGGAIVEGAIPGINNPVAMIGITEKGYMTLVLSVEAEAGHSSTPPPETAVGILSKALVNIESNPFASRLSEPVKLNFEFLAAEWSFPLKMVMSNLWLFEPVVIKVLEQKRPTAAMVKTTTALTIFHSGVKENVIPSYAEAKVNFRLIPGDTNESVKQAIIHKVDDKRVSINFNSNFSSNPAKISSSEGPGFIAIQKTVSEIFSKEGAPVYAAPYMLMAGTDSKHYESITDNTYRFNPMHTNLDDMKRIHGINERMSIHDYLDMIRFFHQFIINSNES